MRLSSSSSRLPELQRRDLVFLGAAAVVVVGGYLLASALTYRIGFPLDDAWIHQTYARNLALLHQWSFIPGQPSAGSTSPLWTFLLSIGFFLHLSPYLWTYLLGFLLLFGFAVFAERIVRALLASYRARFPWVGLFVILEWHFAWSAVSGMETLLHTLILTGVLCLLLTGNRRYLLLGGLTGLSVWVRPDGLTLLGPLTLLALVEQGSFSSRLVRFARLAMGVAALLAPYLLLNLALSGTPMPNTFYAKQAEYASWQLVPWGERLLNIFGVYFAGPALVLLPFFSIKGFKAVRARQWSLVFAFVWWAGYIYLYASRLPLYQHGRYVIPSMGIFFVLGGVGLVETVFSLSGERMRLYRFALESLVVAFTLAFTVYGGYVYAQDVAFIESEMVNTARWVAQNVPAGATIAAHDIGALGYFDHHPLVDLAGLVSPDVIPVVRNESALAVFMDERNVQYLVTFPSWYPKLTQDGRQIFTTHGRFALQAGHDNMAVYRWAK